MRLRFIYVFYYLSVVGDLLIWIVLYFKVAFLKVSNLSSFLIVVDV